MLLSQLSRFLPLCTLTVKTKCTLLHVYVSGNNCQQTTAIPS
uniref:Uncharacterized protein n=1 Tax=Anguilla anguilla TaxID=7936 RepID=A0A0E9W3Z6_ANGAN